MKPHSDAERRRRSVGEPWPRQREVAVLRTICSTCAFPAHAIDSRFSMFLKTGQFTCYQNRTFSFANNMVSDFDTDPNNGLREIFFHNILHIVGPGRDGKNVATYVLCSMSCSMRTVCKLWKELRKMSV
jgi:hypothetical protein